MNRKLQNVGSGLNILRNVNHRDADACRRGQLRSLRGMLIVPKYRRKWRRAMRHSLFGGAEW
jgi:hypothetical protein